MKRLLHWFKHVLLMLGLVFACLSNVMAAMSWPTNIVLSGVEKAPAGTVLASVDVSQTFPGYSLSITGELYAMMGFKDSLQNYGDSRKGIYKLTEELGIAFVGTIEISHKPWLSSTRSVSFMKDSIDTQIATKVLSRAETASFNLLTGVLMDSASFGSTSISVNGRVVLVKLTNESLTPSQVTLPNITLTICGGYDFVQYEYQDVLVNGGGTSVINPRICEVSLLTSPNISFGTIKSDLPSGLLAGNIETRVGLQCNGSSTEVTPVYLEIIPTLSVSRDARAIGLTIAGDSQSPSDSLVVKAKLNQNDTTACSTVKGGWAALSPNRHLLDSIKKNLESYSNSYSIYWSLCKLKDEKLPAGSFSGSATLSITFN